MTKGFSLLELSIVLVIIGLIAGGIVAGSSMIRAAELRSVITEYTQYQTAVHAFKDKYLGLPGDLKNATAFWGDDAAACADAGVADGTPGTCNGDGNGTILENAPAAGQAVEGFQAWKQLMLAGLISGTYTGIAGPNGTGHSITGENVPASKLSGGCWHLEDDQVGGTQTYAIDYSNHYMEFGASSSTGGDCSNNPILIPEEAWNIDKKTDDGRPAYGRITANFWDSACTDATTMTDFDSDYRLFDTSVQCSLNFLSPF